MSRLTGTDVYGLMEAYNAVYSPKQLTEEQVWEGVENWVNALVEEGYDLSYYTWEEMYDAYIAEKAAIPMTPAQIAVGRARRAAAAQRLAQNATNPGERAAAAAATERVRTASGETIRGNNPSSQSQPGSTVNSSSTAQPQSSTRTAQPYSNRGVGRQDNIRSTQTPNAPRITKPNLRSAAMGALTVAGAGYDIYDKTKERQAQGERLRTAVPKAAVEAGGGAAGAQAAATLAAKVLPKNPYIAIPGTTLAGIAGYYGGVKGAEGIVKKLESPFGGGEDALRKANEKRGVQQSRQVAAKANTYGANKGSALTGIGGPTSVSQNKDGTGFMSTGSGSQRKTVQLAKTQLVKDPTTGKQRVGDLAYKGGKAVYLARPSAASSDTNLLSRLSRATGIGGQRERDSAAAKKDYRAALKNTQTYQKKLGITPKPAVGPKIVGPKIVGPKIVGAKPAPPKPPAGGGMGGMRGGR